MNDFYLKYWTGVDTESPSYIKNDLKGEEFSIRCYFDNDSDELINHKGKNGLVDLDEYREMIKSLKCMGYNAIDIHDQLGRAEFYLWDSYKQYWDYKADLDHIEAIIDMIHEEGMLVQIPMYLAWGFDPIGKDAECWSVNQNLWCEKWISYMEGPLGKGDIFLLRPRSPIYDTAYRCQCKVCDNKGDGRIMTEVFAALEEIILSRKPSAKLICDLYAEGYELWNNNSFKVSNKWLLLVGDSGFGRMPEYEKAGVKSHKWGVYLHAGFWLNHTIQDPHIDAFEDSIRYAREKGLTDYILVNGQSFKNFILNIEVVMALIFMGDTYNRREFITEWSGRIFGINDCQIANQVDRLISDIASLHNSMAIRPAYLDPKSDMDKGFTGTMINVVYALIDELNDNDHTSGSFADGTIPFDETSLPYGLDKARALVVESNNILKASKAVACQLHRDNMPAWNDQFTFPMVMMYELLELCVKLFEAKAEGNKKEVALEQLQRLINIANDGSELVRFKHWHNTHSARMHHPIPDATILN